MTHVIHASVVEAVYGCPLHCYVFLFCPFFCFPRIILLYPYSCSYRCSVFLPSKSRWSSFCLSYAFNGWYLEIQIQRLGFVEYLKVHYFNWFQYLKKIRRNAKKNLWINSSLSSTTSPSCLPPCARINIKYTDFISSSLAYSIWRSNG